MKARRRLGKYGRTPEDAVSNYVAHLERCQTSITVLELSDRLQLAKQRENRSRPYLNDLRLKLTEYTEAVGWELVCALPSASNVWPDELKALAGKGLIFCPDNDEAGRGAAQRLSRSLATVGTKLFIAKANAVSGATVCPCA